MSLNSSRLGREVAGVVVLLGLRLPALLSSREGIWGGNRVAGHQ